MSAETIISDTEHRSRRTADLGFFAARDGWKYLVEDVKHLTDLMTAPLSRPAVFPARALDGFADRTAVPARLRREAVWTHSCCRTVGPIAASGSIVHLADSVARSRGITYRSGLLSNLVFKGFNRKIKQPKTVFDWLSRDEAVVSLYQSDEKCNFVFTATGFRDLFTLITKAEQSGDLPKNTELPAAAVHLG